MSEKKYYWLKLKYEFFTGKEVKALRRIAGGDTYTIIYLKMQLMSLATDGVLFFEGVETDLASELALELDEDVENVRMTLAYLKSKNMIDQMSEGEFFLNRVPEMIGVETAAAARMRRMREKNSVTMFAGVTQALHDGSKTFADIDIEQEKDKETDTDTDTEKEDTVS